MAAARWPGENGSVLCYSYRDPSPQASLKHFDACQAYLAQFIESEAPLDTYIISALAQDDPLRSLGQKSLWRGSFMVCWRDKSAACAVA